MVAHDKGIVGEIRERPFAFSLAFVGLFMLSFVFLAAVGAIPEPASPTTHTNSTAVTTTGKEAPVRVVAKDIGMDVTIANPDTTDIEVLDEALLRGAVRYPTSALLGEVGTVLLFGHSSYLPVVYNQAYKAFNKIQDLKAGQTVSVYSSDTEYRYEVSGVRLADATEDVIELAADGKHLTLVTCDSFGRKTSRFVVTANFVGTYSLGN